MPAAPAPTTGIPIDYRTLPWAGAFVRDYCHTFDKLETFFTGPPTVPATWAAAIDARKRHRPDPAILDILARQLAARDAPAPARDAVARLGDDRGVAIVTGQQAGLFGGPMFTLLKAVTAIALARQVAERHGLDVTPIFWVDAEDHDLDEVRTCHVLSTDLARVPVTLDIDAPPGTAAAGVTLAASIGGTLETLRDALPTTEFSDEVLAALGEAYAPGHGLASAFARWLDRLLGPHGLVVYDASDPAAKPLARAIFAGELDDPGGTSRLAASAGAALTARGYHAQVSPGDDAVALFRIEGARLPIRTAADRFRVGEQLVDAAALRADVEADPGRFSPNVLLRPITQDALLPSVAYVAGPNELAYLGQLREVYARFGVPMPIMYPRASATIVDAATVKFLQRYDVDFTRLQPQDDAALNALLAAALPPQVEAAVAAAEAAVAERLGAVEAEVPRIDPTLAGAVESTRGRMERDLRTLRGKIIQAAKRRDETLRRQFHRAQAQSFPGGEPQERSVAGIYFLNRYGFAFIDRLLDTLPVEPGQHWLLTV